MDKLHFFSFYIRQTFNVVEGPHTGKFCFLREIDFENRTVTTKTGAVLPADHVKPVLRQLKDIGDVEAEMFFKKYWGNDYTLDYIGDTGSANFQPKRRKPNKQDMIRIFEGKDYIAGDFDEIVNLVPYLLESGLDIFGGEARDWCIIKNRYGS